jgi:dihydrofolate reductase
MRKIIESALMSVDGVVGNPAVRGIVDYRDGEVEQEALERLSGCDAMLMGRRTYEAFAEVWPRHRSRGPGEQHPQARVLLDLEEG